MMYMKTDGNDLLGLKMFESADGHLSPAEAQALGKPWWLPYVNVPRPTYDSVTHHAPVKLDDVITATEVTQAWSAPVAKTQAEIDAEALAQKDSAMDRLNEASSIDKVLGAAIFELVNDVRVLKGQGTITAAQFKTWLRKKF
jgi:hypothetical protein